MKAREIMLQPVVTVREDDSLEEVARTMLQHRIGCVPVVNHLGELGGIITQPDFAAKEKGIPFSTFRAPQVLGQWLTSEGVERIYGAARQMTAREIMRTQVVTVTEEDSVNKAVELMLRHDINRIPVVRDGKLVGIIARHDLLKLMARTPIANAIAHE
jgi:CBS domain-containing protein